jgi:Flp pilus assembly protein TadB
VLVTLPIAFAAILSAVQPDYLAPLVRDPAGRGLLAFALVAWFVGFALIRRILAVQV